MLSWRRWAKHSEQWLHLHATWAAVRYVGPSRSYGAVGLETVNISSPTGILLSDNVPEVLAGLKVWKDSVVPGIDWGGMGVFAQLDIASGAVMVPEKDDAPKVGIICVALKAASYVEKGA
ncbi:hypothetical protein PGQ11_012631 [Apiospora arundinis]|uniref:Uncharacterized protein n=1 Tax=Apiospora arundinis TaxID=335852 RepID=A0ABR2I3J7_9PEZI